MAAFLRGVERRGVVFAELHCGDAVQGEQGFAIALRMFHDHAREQPFARWPGLFWRALLASPQLRAAGAGPARWPKPLAVLGEVGNGPRAALLLRLVAGLGDAEAAEVLGVAPATYRLALRQALPRRSDGEPDPDAWRALGTAVQDALRHMPAERLAHLARLRQAAVQGRRPELIGPMPPPASQAPVATRPWPRLRRLLWAGFAACLVALAASFVWPFGWSGAPGDGQVRLTALPPPEAPASRYDAATRLLTERDFELLAAGDPAPPRDDPAFFAWFAAQRDAGHTAPDAGMRDPMPVDTAADKQPETVDAP